MKSAFLFIAMSLTVLCRTSYAKKFPGYYINNQNDTVKTTFFLQEERFGNGIWYVNSSKAKLLTPKEARIIIIKTENRDVKFVSRKDIIKNYTTPKGKGLLDYGEMKSIVPGDTIHEYPVFMEIYDDSGYVVFGYLDYIYEGNRVNRSVLQKGTESPYIGHTTRQDLLAYFGDCPLVKQEIVNTQKMNPPMKEFTLSLVKTYNDNCAPNAFRSTK